MRLLNRRGLGADGIVGPGDEQDREIHRDTRFVLRKPQTVESLEHRIGHAVGEGLDRTADRFGTDGFPRGRWSATQNPWGWDVFDKWRVEMPTEQPAEDLAGRCGLCDPSPADAVARMTLLVLGFVEPGHRAHRAAQDRAGKQIAVVLNVGLGQRRAHAVPERDERESRILGPSDVGQLLDIGSHVLPRGQARLSEVLGTGRVAVPAQVEGVHDVALGGQEAGEAVVSSAVLGDAVSDLHESRVGGSRRAVAISERKSERGRPARRT